MSEAKDSKQVELLELGKKLQQFYDSGYVNKKQALLFAFYKGLASGLGTILGGTIVIGVVIWFLSLFSQIPLVGHFMHILDQTLQNR